MSSFGQRQKEIPAIAQEPEVPKDDPWSDDVLNRRELAEKLITFIDGQTQPLVISVDGAWGSGKTFFLKRLGKNMEDEGFETIYFNAWEDDFHSDPLVALVGQIYKKFNKPDIPFCRKAWISLKVLLLGIQTYLKIELRIVLNIEDLLIKLKNSLKNLMKTEKDEVIDQYIKHNKSKKILKDNLQELAQEYRKKNDQPLVFIIDELDRCRPTFAIELLERVKHIFDIENIVFILGMDKTQLEKSIRSVYGDIASDIYLRRFFDFEFSLPQPDLEGFCKCLIRRYDLESVFQSLGNDSEEDQFFEGDIKILQKRMQGFFSLLDISLRDLDGIIRSLVVIAKTCEQDGRLLSYAVVPLLVIKQKNKKLYEEIIEEQTPFIEAFNYITEEMKLVPGEIEAPLSSPLQIIEATCYLLYPDEEKDEVIQQIRKLLQQIDDEAEDIWDGVDTGLMSRDLQGEHREKVNVRQIVIYIDMLVRRDSEHLNLSYIRKLINLVDMKKNSPETSDQEDTYFFVDSE